MARFRNVSKQDLEVTALGRVVKAGATVDVPAALREQFDESPLFAHAPVKRTPAKKKAAKAAAAEPPAPLDDNGNPDAGDDGDTSEGEHA